MVVLDLANPDSDAANVVSLPCVGGTSVQVTREGEKRIAAFAKGISRLVIPDLLATDASWVVATPEVGDIWAGNVTNLWLNGTLQCLASTPVDMALLDKQCVVVAKQPSWVSVRQPADMTNIQCNKQPISVQRNDMLNLIRFRVGPGESHITWA